MRHSCGCINEVHDPSGVLHCVNKCEKHRAKQRDPITLDGSYYEELGCIVDGIPQCAGHLIQLAEAIGLFPFGDTELTDNAWALEIGCGASMYAPGLLRMGYRYVGLDASEWACRWTGSTFAVNTTIGSVESIRELGVDGRKSWDLILAAHVLEHLKDGPGVAGFLAGMLKPGGELWIIVPDDSDPVNSDHRWFFTEATLRRTIESAGLVVGRFAVRKYVKHENFLYCRARKPG